MGAETRGCDVLALRQLLLSSYLLKHTPFNVLSLHIGTLVWTGRGNSTPPFLFHAPCRRLINVFAPVEYICSGFQP